MTEPMVATGHAAEAAAGEAKASLRQAFRHLWLAGLGVVAVIGQQAQDALQALEGKGQQLEPSVTAPFRRAGEAAGRVVGGAGSSVKHMGATVVGIGRRSAEDVKDQVEHLLDDRLGPALERLGIPTREDFQALTQRIDELESKSTRKKATKADDE